MAGPNETPVLEGRIPGTDKTVRQHPDDEFGSIPTNAAEMRDAVRNPSGTLGANATVVHEDGSTQRGADAMAEGRDRGQAAAQETTNAAADRAQRDAQDVQNQTNGPPETDEEREAGKRTLKDKMRGYRVSDIHMPSKAAIRRTVFLERASSSFEGRGEDHDTLPGPFAPQLLKIQGVTRRVGGLVDDLAEVARREEAAVETTLVGSAVEQPAPSSPRQPAGLVRLGTVRRALVRRAPPSSFLSVPIVRESRADSLSFAGQPHLARPRRPQGPAPRPPRPRARVPHRGVLPRGAPRSVHLPHEEG